MLQCHLFSECGDDCLFTSFVQEDDDDDLDLFGEPTEEEKKAAAEREAKAKASGKVKPGKMQDVTQHDARFPPMTS